jgi:hypothetical protein
MKKTLHALSAATLLLGTLSSVMAEEAKGLNLFDDVTFSGEIRPRYENADIKDNDKDGANAFTVRTMLGVKANKAFGTDMLGAYVEALSVNNLGYDNYNSTANGQTEYDVIVDPNQARLTQAYIDVKLPAKTLLRAGRQMVNIDNQRFVGAVDWRQMRQTFDAAALVSAPVEGLSVMAAYVYGINGVKVQPNNKATETGSALFNVSYKAAEAIKLTGYAYLLASISDTYGISAQGTLGVADGVKLSYWAEYAMQSDPSLEYRVEDVKADASYMNFDLAASMAGITLGANYEVLGKAEGEAANGFYTPLATLHKFNGWADVFLLSNNAAGLIDMNGRIAYKAAGLGKVMAVYHSFSAEEGPDDLGSEIDLSYANAVPGVNGLNGLIKAAFYSAGDEAAGAYVANDKSVVWVQLDYKF